MNSTALRILRNYSTTSTKQWIQRQTNDHFVKQAHRQSLRSRASFKLLELIKAQPQLIRKGGKVLDLGAAPGGWTQVAVAAVSRDGVENLMKGGRFVGPNGDAESMHVEGEPVGLFDEDIDEGEVAEEVKFANHVDNGGRVVAVDLLPMDPIPGAQIVMGDMTEASTQDSVIQLCGGKVDVVLSDMAHSFTGTRSADVIRVMDLCKTAFSVAERVLKVNGNFVCKFIRGEDDGELKDMLQQRFRIVNFDKPMASRRESAEAYLICLEYTGTQKASEDVELAESKPQINELFPILNPRTSRKIPLNDLDSRPKPKPSAIPHWSQMKPGTKVRVLLISDLKGKPIGKGMSNAGKDKLVEGEVEVLLSRDYHRSGVKVRLTDGRIGRVSEVLQD